tara:strand:+ start:162 stop:548 length:387 start_codon:yes stop_codon:yes gene_type:complete
MFLRELIEDRITTRPIMQNGRKVYKHDYSDSVFPSEKVARDDERRKKPVTTQKLRTFGGKSSDVQQSNDVDMDQIKNRLFGIIQAMDPKADMQKLERMFDKFNKIFKGNLDSMDNELSKKEQELGISI